MKGRDDGNAILEFVFVAVLVTVPLLYLVVAIATVQQSRLAVTSAAREAGRAFATAESAGEAPERALAAARIALRAQGVDDEPELRFVAAGAPCDSATITPTLAPGAGFVVCVQRRVELPAVPTVLAGKGVTVVGRFDVHIDDFRTVRRSVASPP